LTYPFLLKRQWSRLETELRRRASTWALHQASGASWD